MSGGGRVPHILRRWGEVGSKLSWDERAPRRVLPKEWFQLFLWAC